MILLLVYVLLALLLDPDGHLGTDTGAKVATLDHMVEGDTLRPAVGYWAESWDPEGAYHPLFDTRQNEEGEWINVTTLPMLVAAYPLYDVGGYRLALLLPMLGAVGAAVAARDLGRVLHGSRAGVRAFWIVGLASPMAIYALDLWEHSIGAALMVAAASFLVRAVSGDNRLRWPLLAGVALGVSATMRTETFVVALAFVGVVCLAMLRSRPAAAVRIGLLSVVGFVGPWLANATLESNLGGNPRSGRVSGAAGRDVWAEVGDRLREAFITWFGLPGIGYPEGPLVGLVVVGALVGGRALQHRGQRRAATLVTLSAPVLVLLVLATAGLSFVPGALIASPVAVAAVWATRLDRNEVVVLAMALTATVLTWTFQFLGGAWPQWGGRYILAPTLVLTVLGAAHLGRASPFLRRTVVAMAVGVTIFGVAWLGVRSHDVAAFFDDLADRPDDVIISTNGFLVREAGPAYDERRFLSLGRGATVSGAVDIVERAGLDTLAVLASDRTPPELDADFVATERLDFLGVTLWYHRFAIS